MIKCSGLGCNGQYLLPGNLFLMFFLPDRLEPVVPINTEQVSSRHQALQYRKLI